MAVPRTSFGLVVPVETVVVGVGSGVITVVAAGRGDVRVGGDGVREAGGLVGVGDGVVSGNGVRKVGGGTLVVTGGAVVLGGGVIISGGGVGMGVGIIVVRVVIGGGAIVVRIGMGLTRVKTGGGLGAAIVVAAKVIGACRSRPVIMMS